MRNEKVKKMTLCALFTAFTCLFTMIAIPVTGIGYLNAGDSIVILSAWFLGPLYGAFSAAFGSMLADLFLGYGIYAPATFIIKGIMAIVFALLYKILSKKNKVVAFVVGAVVAEIIMVFGYFIHAFLILGEGWGATATIYANSFQGIFGIIASSVLASVLRKIKK